MRKSAAPTQSPEWSKDAWIYEVNIRQYTAEGSFNAFSTHLERLQKMGIKILWLMPIYPIGEKNRKGSLGSPYSIKDYRAINPALGTKEDFNTLVLKVHQLGMYVILDWVANHTSWDNALITLHRDWYTHNDKGQIISPVADWSDVAKLNYANEDLRRYMMESMAWWVEESDIDGFRCDMTEMVPAPFWTETLHFVNRQKKDLFWLAESESPTMCDLGFHATYSWKIHHAMNEVIKGTKSVKEYSTMLAENHQGFSDHAYRMVFTSNHDENSWQGTEYERLGEAAITFTVLNTLIPDMPLLYSGQEAMNNKRLKFFDKDEINWTRIPLDSLYNLLIKLKKNKPILWNGSYGGNFEILPNNREDKVLSFIRKKDGKQMVAIFNLSPQDHEIIVGGNIDGFYYDLFTTEKVNIQREHTFKLHPWEYKILLQ